MLFGPTIYSIVFTSNKAYTFYFTFQSMCSSDYKKVCATFMKLHIWLLISLALSRIHIKCFYYCGFIIFGLIFIIFFSTLGCAYACATFLLYDISNFDFIRFVFYLHFANDRIFGFFPRSRVIDNLQIIINTRPI